MTAGEPGPITRVRVVVLVSRLHAPTLRALAWASAVRAHSFDALTVQADEAATQRLLADWVEHDIQAPLTVLESPTGDLVEPVVRHVERMVAAHPRDLVQVFVPQYVVGRWWEWLLHHRGARRLRARLQGLDRVVLTAVPWQLPDAVAATDTPAATP